MRSPQTQRLGPRPSGAMRRVRWVRAAARGPEPVPCRKSTCVASFELALPLWSGERPAKRRRRQPGPPKLQLLVCAGCANVVAMFRLHVSAPPLAGSAPRAADRVDEWRSACGRAVRVVHSADRHVGGHDSGLPSAGRQSRGARPSADRAGGRFRPGKLVKERVVAVRCRNPLPRRLRGRGWRLDLGARLLDQERSTSRGRVGSRRAAQGCARAARQGPGIAAPRAVGHAKSHVLCPAQPIAAIFRRERDASRAFDASSPRPTPARCAATKGWKRSATPSRRCPRACSRRSRRKRIGKRSRRGNTPTCLGVAPCRRGQARRSSGLLVRRDWLCQTEIANSHRPCCGGWRRMVKSRAIVDAPADRVLTAARLQGLAEIRPNSIGSQTSATRAPGERTRTPCTTSCTPRESSSRGSSGSLLAHT